MATAERSSDSTAFHGVLSLLNFQIHSKELIAGAAKALVTMLEPPRGIYDLSMGLLEKCNSLNGTRRSYLFGPLADFFLEFN